MLSLMGKIGICIFVDDNNLYRCEKQFPAKLHSLSYAMQIILNLLNNFPKDNSRNYKSMSASDQQWGALQLKIIFVELQTLNYSIEYHSSLSIPLKSSENLLSFSVFRVFRKRTAS